MAVRVQIGARPSLVAVRQKNQVQERGFYIQYKLNGKLFSARKLDPADFSPNHFQTLGTARFNPEGKLIFSNPNWQSVWLGAGEEKTVFLIVDEERRAFALELLVRGGYLNGRLTEGYYLADLHLSQIGGLKRDPNALLSLTFSGEAKAREYIYGETLAGPALAAFRPKANLLAKAINQVSMCWAAYVTAPRYGNLRQIFKDAHEANVMIELVPLHNPERKSHYLFPIPALAQDGRLHWFFYRLTPIDVRALPH